MPLTPETIAHACRCPLAAVDANWPLLVAALEERGVSEPLVQLGLAATVAVETAWTFRPINELGGAKYFNEHYDTGERARRLGNTPEADGDGALYHGRGFVQLTGRSNYRVVGQALGIDLEGHPDLALDPTQAARIMAHYWVTRHVVEACRAADWPRVRRLVNGGTNGWTEFRGCVVRLLEVLA
nr:glycoside hydrolase family 19 protein [uncultured Holophaga sp.]